MSRVLEEVELKLRPDGTTCTAMMRVLDPEDLDEVEKLQAHVYETLEDRSFYHPLDRETLGLSLGDHGMTVGTVARGQLVGFRSILYPRPGDENLGEESGLTGIDLEKVAHLERTVVHPDFRGNSLQRRMTGYIIEETIKTNRLAEKAAAGSPFVEQRTGYPVHHRPWRFLFSTVAPMNYASMKDKFACGMVVVRLELRYSGLWRYVFFRDILAPTRLDTSTVLDVDGSDIERQLELVGDGFLAYMQQWGPGEVQVRYAKPTFHTLEVGVAGRVLQR